MARSDAERSSWVDKRARAPQGSTPRAPKIPVTYSELAENPMHSTFDKSRGFTLIELMITVALVAILAAIALPSFQSYVRKARRADAATLLQNAALSQEKWRLSNTTYATSVNALSGVCPTSGNCDSQSRYYRLSIPTGSATATGFTVTATAIAGTSQANDTACTAMSIAQTSTGIQYTPTECWKK